jgi:CheY-like chemotaxis protein
METRTILLVEDEQTLRLSMVRGLSKLPGLEVADAGTAREAKRLLAVRPPSLVISDLDLPDGSGIEIASELDRLGLRAPIVFVSAFVGRFRSRIPTRADVEVWEKPVSLDRLRALVEDKLGVGDDAAPSPFGVADYVQLAGMGRHSVVIEVRGASGRGQVTIHRGELWSATDRKGKGIDAFRRLAFLQSAQVTCRTLALADLPPRDIDGAAESVLLDAARAFDEHERQSSVTNEVSDDDWESAFSEAPTTATHAIPAPTSATAPPPTKPSARSFEDAYDRGIDALLHKDHAAAYAAFVEASRFSPDDRRVVANLTRLRAMGFS